MVRLKTNNSFINKMGADWNYKAITYKPPHKKKRHTDDWNWFFQDADHDGVMNGVDCRPYNKRKQDAFPAIQWNFNTTTPPLMQQAMNNLNQSRLPPGAITSGPNQNISVVPRPQSFTPAPTIQRP